MHKLADELIEYKALLAKAGVKQHEIRKMRPIGISVNEVRRFQQAVGSDQPSVKAGARCELLGVPVIVLHADGDLET